MGGGDLNMKKSWHPLLLKNQERVWLEEKKSLEEKKKLDQLRKEKEEERQLQELQRLQEEQTGKKRTEKLEWMYATPATGSSQNPNDLEDYLLGKKRVDKMLTADENDKVGAAHKNFIAVQNANSVRDIASKIREDPLLAIKQQEQAAYQALLSNPLRLAKMQKELGVKPKKEKKREKEERKRMKHERRHHRDRNSRTLSPSSRRIDRDRSPLSDDRHRLPRVRSPRYRSSSRSRSPGPSRRRDESDYHSMGSRGYYQEPEPRRGRTRSRSPRRDSRSDSEERYRTGSTSYKREDDRPSRYSPPSRHLDHGKHSRSPSPRRRSPPPKRFRSERSPPPPRASNGLPPRSFNGNGHSNNKAEEDRAARLAAMTSNANSVSEDRQKRLAALLEKEKAELQADERARAKSKGMSGFLSQEQKRVFGGVGGLEDRIKRGRSGLVVDAD
ncbi:Pre-mRNA splicing factor-domain-containing protein [Flammula alnicola]|nr:Pre-mRNA splicing factor-domain-containing protein [Flammula alnicola]